MRPALDSRWLTPAVFRLEGADFYREFETMQTAVTQQDLAELRAGGFDGVWFAAVLRELVPTSLFEPFEQKSRQRLQVLRAVSETLADAGIALWLYLNEPRGYPACHPFWHAHPECRGDSGCCLMSNEPETNAMCSRSEPVRVFLRESMAELCHALPQLAGVFVITASEYHTHCFSHRPLKGPEAMPDCPRCAGTDRSDTVADILNALADGVRDAGAQTRVVAWTWSWARHIEPDPQPRLIGRLTPEIALLSDFERGQVVQRAGRAILVDEYSLVVAGPSPRFCGHRILAAATGRTCYAKLQINTTHELPTVPNLPVPGRVYDKLAAMFRDGVRACLAAWNFGLSLTVNTFAFRLLGAQPPPGDRHGFLVDLAATYFEPGVCAEACASAWEQFEVALAFHPQEEAFLYRSPLAYAPAYPLAERFSGRPMGPSWLVHDWGDRLEDALGPYTFAELIALLTELVSRWPTETYAAALADGRLGPRARQELDTAISAGHFFRSCRNVFRWYDALHRHDADSAYRALEDEQRHLPLLLSILERDDRIGFHQECRARLVSPEHVRKKLDHLAQIRVADCLLKI